MVDQISELEANERLYVKPKIYCAFCGVHLPETKHYKKDGSYHKPACEKCADKPNNGKNVRVTGQQENPVFDGIWWNSGW